MKNMFEFVRKVRHFPLTVRDDVSVDIFVRQNKGLFNFLSIGISDEKFPLSKDFHGEIEFWFFEVIKKITNPKSFFEMAIEREFIFPGYKGICVLWYDWRKKQLSGNTNDSLPSGWILSPNKIPEDDINKRTGIPCLDTKITGVAPHQKFGDILCSGWSNKEIPEGMYIVFVKYTNKKPDK